MSSQSMKNCSTSSALQVGMLLFTLPAMGFALVPLFEPPVVNPFGLPAGAGTFTAPEFVDLDGDGDKDCVIGRLAVDLLYYRNSGSAASPAFVAASLPSGLSTGPSQSVTPAFADIDGDGDQDFFFGDNSGNISFQQNTGNSTNPSFLAVQVNPFGLSDIGVGSRIDLYNIDGDLDQDIIASRSTGEVLFLRNTGSSTSPAFGLPLVNPEGLSTLQYGFTPEMGDLDGDGDGDVLRGVLGPSLIYWQRTSAGFFDFPVKNPYGLTSVGGNSSPALVDIDGDGDLDLLVANGSGPISFFRNTPDTTPPGTPSMVRNGPTTTDADVVSFTVAFTEKVGSSFEASDLLVGGPASTRIVTPSPADPVFKVLVQFDDPNENGGTFLVIPAGSFADLAGNVSTAEYSSGEFTITNYPKGDVSKNGVFDLADVALLADANLSLATLP